MLFHPGAAAQLPAIHATLTSLNAEADRYRAMALAARRGVPPSAAAVAAALEAQDTLAALLDEIDRALETLPPGHEDFGALLKAQTAAAALSESVMSSLDVLETVAPVDTPEPVAIAHHRLMAAE